MDFKALSCDILLGLIILMIYLELFHIYLKIIFFTIWFEHVVMHCWDKSLKTVLKLIVFQNIIGLSIL